MSVFQTADDENAGEPFQQMHTQCLWTFNKFEISKVQWKATAVPALTYANSELASRNLKTLTAYLDKTQMAAGVRHLALLGTE